MQIQSLHAYEIIASGGYPSLEVRVALDTGAVGIASVPYGASAGSHEATVLTDTDSPRYNGHGMLKAVRIVHEEIAPHLIGQQADDQRRIDQIMLTLDGTPQKTKLGGNTILAVSLAVARAAAAAHQLPLYRYIAEQFQTGAQFHDLPQPMAVVIEGGKHADHSTDVQEYCFSVVQQGSRAESIRMMLETYHALHKILKEQHLSTNVGNEGAFAPSGITSNEAPFAFMLSAIERAGYQAGHQLGISLDVAASEFYTAGQYTLALENRTLSAADLSTYFTSWLDKYPIITIEDPFHEDDWANWTTFKHNTDERKIELIGDDLTVTNPVRLQQAIDQQAISSILIKLNQIGSLTETVDCCMLAKSHGMARVTSHRGGGETNDAAMVDLAVAVDARFIKVGPTRGERVAKYNRLMEIERELARI